MTAGDTPTACNRLLSEHQTLLHWLDTVCTSSDASVLTSICWAGMKSAPLRTRSNASCTSGGTSVLSASTGHWSTDHSTSLNNGHTTQHTRHCAALMPSTHCPTTCHTTKLDHYITATHTPLQTAQADYNTASPHPTQHTPCMLIICPNLRAAPRTRHKVSTNRSRLAGVKNTFAEAAPVTHG